MLFETKKEACEALVREMNAIDQSMIQKLMETAIDEWQEVTAPSVGDRVFVFDKESEGEIIDIDDDGDYIIRLDDEPIVIDRAADKFDVLREDFLPMWGTMWSFGDSIDDWWLEEKDGIRIMSECGFRIYHHEEWGYFFGIDGAGYDFYEAHWIPLYDARGLKWHKEEEGAA